MDEQLDRAISSAPSGSLIWHTCRSVTLLLLEKNRRYGDSFREPLRVFSSADPAEQLRIRADDKLSRIVQSGDGDIEDSLIDLVGYLLLILALRDEAGNDV